MILILLEFAKAFYTVPHDKLIEKVRAYGFDERLIKWLSNFLKKRRQQVVMGDVVTDWLEVLCGVPQGSVLGPLLFVIYIDDMPDSIANILELFADDSKLINIIKCAEDLAQLKHDLANISEWSVKWKMSFECRYVFECLDECR